VTGFILAAGVGSRLGSTDPKGLMVLPGGETILGRQVRILKQAGIDSIVVIVGYKHEMIEDALEDVTFISNPRYAETNTAKSLLCAVDGLSDDVLWLNGDVVFDEAVISRMLKQRGNVVLVNSAECGEEEVKYVADGNGSIHHISKQVQDAQGEALGVNLIRYDSLEGFREALDHCGDNDYFEHAMQRVIDNGTIFKILELAELNCIEIDFLQDWKKAQEMFSSRK